MARMEMKEKPIVYIPVLFNAVNMIGFEVPLYKIWILKNL